MRKSVIYLIVTCFYLAGSAVAPAESATITVTAGAADVLLDGNSSCALREAIQNINDGADTYADCTATGTYGTGDTITLPAGTYTNTIATTNEDNNANGDLDILVSMTINGAGAGATIIDGNSIDRVLHVVNAVTVNINDVAIQNGSATYGGGILNYGTLFPPMKTTTPMVTWIFLYP